MSFLPKQMWYLFCNECVTERCLITNLLNLDCQKFAFRQQFHRTALKVCSPCRMLYVTYITDHGRIRSWDLTHIPDCSCETTATWLLPLACMLFLPCSLTTMIDLYHYKYGCGRTHKKAHVLHLQENVSVAVARIFNTFGPRMHMNDGRVVSNFILQALQNIPMTVCVTCLTFTVDIKLVN